MKFRDYYFKREATVADSDTVIIDVTVKDPISYIEVEYEATNGSTSCVDHELHDDVSKIEVVDGSDVIASLSMLEWKALNFFELGRFPHELLSEVGGAKQEEKIVIHFGRFPDDPEYYLDPNKFKNLQLKLTHNLTISSTAGFASGSGKVTVMARLIEEGAGPYKGFMTTKQRYSWTSASSGDEEIDIYRDYVYRFMILKALLSTYRPDEIITKVKLSCDADKYIPFEMYTEDILDKMIARYGYVQQKKTLLTADDGSALTDVYDIQKAHIDARVDDHIATIETVDAEKITNSLYDMSSPATPAFQTTAKQCDLFVEGNYPCACFVLPIGGGNDEKDWFDPTKYGSVKLFCTQATANAACALITQQIRR
ncbi:MAG: hypothetical protein DRP09_19205 [Candidatus Thorarchaeota archaeon]|nr:MAG: hypothetical protein DRP09_19205 [Candidatus Thorarchaeota archaeon]